ncbi:MAG: hypothetical protein A3C11_02890 [Candidatus Sungbacteria bacterium RIFCSPHIGHO2_02_FULL_49_12]|uniref:VTT domain-containing protein n=1 Tax=Candidatus Sungbacteria bacterium RIFCSPHIGHO2_02_FULL_49_12 TaxID=1802271 RepID=A0A1G2KMB4_9BACT|nr:MAG: hypothetical protein A3C11_02890 [Candidatus Sungbacteria bacterium RIFCSPHIGHO2_02_FULL_49_12]
MFDIVAFIKAAGYLGIFAVVFAESGILIGMFFPGDSLLFTAGFLASQGYLDISILAALAFVAAVLGDQVGYQLGRRFGPKIFNRDRSFFFNPQQIARARNFYEKHGGKAVTMARFLPVVRTLAPVIAGVGEMRYGAFLFYNLIGGALWGVGLPFLGYFLGTSIPNVDRYLVPIVIGIVVLSLLPSAIHILRDPEMRRHLWKR